MKVSVLVPVYNLERFIEPCLESLLTQAVDFDFEVIAIDDGSSDGSWALMQKLAAHYPQLRALQNPQNIGLARTQKRLLTEARGDYIAYVDGDDLALPGKLQAMADYLDAHAECAVCYHEAEVFDSDSGMVTALYSRDYYNAAYVPGRASAEHLIRYGCFINASAVAFRRHAHLLEAVDDGCKIILDHPWHILNALYGKGTVDFISGVVGRYRIHADSFGGQTKRSPQRREQVLADQLRACDNARAFGIDDAIIAAGKAHYRFATALYFLNQGDMARFTRFINESVVNNWFFDDRHQLAWELRAEPEQVAQRLCGQPS